MFSFTRTTIPLVTAALLTGTASGASAPAGSNLFSLKSKTELMAALGAAKASESSAIEIGFPEIAENPNLVPLKVRSRLPNTESIAIIVENNPTPLAAVYRPVTATDMQITPRVRMAKSSVVHVVVRAGGKSYVTSKFVKVTPGGCGGGSFSTRAEVADTGTIGRTRFRSSARGSAIEVHGMIQHPMETGLRPINEAGDMAPAVNAKTGRAVAAHYIEWVAASLNGRTVAEAQWGPSIAANPIFSVELPESAAGQALALQWKDNLGKHGEAAHTVSR